MNIQTIAQMPILFDRAPITFVRQFDHKGQGRISQRQSRGARNAAGHVGDAVVHHAIDYKGRIFVGRRSASLDAAALIDGHIDDHRTLLHQLQHSAGNQFRRRRTGHEHATDYQIRIDQRLFNRRARGIARHQARAIKIVELLEPRERHIEHRHQRPHAQRNARRVDADHTAAQHHYFRRRHTRHTGQQHAQTALGFLQRVRARLDGHAPRHLAHRREQRQTAALVRHRFIGNGNGVRLD